jgi:ABC-type branched-subunit amino acid transport system ATPase component
MANGEILTEGTPEEVTNDEKVQRVYLGAELIQ